MNKKTLKVLVLALAVLFPMQNVFADYCTSFGNSTHTARYLNAFTLTDGTNEAVVSGIQTSTKQAVYQDKTSVIFETEAGATISFSSITWNGEWMHGYAFADFNNDGTFDSTDVVSYNFYSATDASYGQNSKGETVQNSCNVTAANMPEWTIPSDLAAGDYRFRFKVDWNSLDPCGASDIAGNGGAVVDLTIRIASQASARTISVSVNPAETGTVTINGEAVSELTAEGGITLVATPAAGYKFVNWTVNGEVVSTNAKFVDGTEGDKAYVANFRALEVYTIAVSVNDAAMGTAEATAEGEVYEGTEVTLTATPNEGYKLVNWTVDGVEVSDEESFNTTVTANAEYKANFAEKPAKIDIESIEISLVKYSNYVAENAIDGIYSTYYDSNDTQKEGATATVTLPNELVLDEVKLYFTSSGRPAKGKIQVSSDNAIWTDIEGGEFVKEDIAEDSETNTYLVTIKMNSAVAKYVRFYIVEPSTGYSYLTMYEFEVYEGKVSLPARAISVSVNDDAMGTAYIGTEGTTSVEDQTAAVKLYAVANEGYEFVNWTLNGEEVGTSTMLLDKTEGDKAYVANFKASAVYNVTVSANNSKMGTVEATKTGQIFNGTEITLTATPNEGYEFVNWTVGETVVSKDLSFSVNVVEDADYVANFRVPLVRISPVGVETTFQYNYDIETLIDGLYSGYYSTYQSNGASITVELPEETPVGDIKLYFQWSSYYSVGSGRICVSSDNSVWTDVEGSEFSADDLVYDEKTELDVITIDGKGIPAKYVKMIIVEAGYYMYMNEFEVYEATVNVEPRTISVSVNDEAMGTAYVGAAGTTIVEEETGAVKLVAEVSSEAYRFVNWTLNGEEVSTNKTIVDRTEGDKAYVANFEAKPIYTITAVSSNDELGTVSSTAGEVIYEGDAITFTATPVDGYMFTAWTVGNDTVSVSNPYSITATADLALVANFDRDPLLNRSNWTITASSEETTGEGTNGFATCIIDGKLGTYWHSQWSGSEPGYPHWFMVDMKESKAFDAFEYVSRGTSTASEGVNNGNIVTYALYTSNTEIDPEALENATLVTSGEFTYDGTSRVHRVEFNSVKGQYVMLYATGQSANGKKNAACSEFYLYSNNFAVSVASSNPEIGSAYIGTEGVTSVGCSVEGTDVVTLTAVPADKYQFVNWTLNGEVVSTDAVYTTDLVTESRAYVANFEFAPVAPRTVTATVNNSSKGSVVFLAPESTEASVVSDNIVVAKAVPATTDEFFVNWTINGVEVGTEETYEYLETEDVTIQANFESRYIVTIYQVSGGTISVKADGTSISTGDRVLEGSNLAISVAEDSRSELKKLFVNGVDVFVQYKYNPNFSVAVTGTTVITAEYGDPVCIVTWENIGNGYVEAWEYDTYDEEADADGTLELPLSPDGAQYAWGDEVPFLSTLAIFAYPMGDDVLESITINGEELNLEEDFYYGDYFIPEVESALHIVATFSGVGNGIESADAEVANVYAVAGGIKVVTADAANVSIYSIAGVLVAEQTISETTTIAMEQGVYIVKVADKVAKVIVK